MRYFFYSALLTFGVLVAPPGWRAGDAVADPPQRELQPVYRYFHPDSRDHLLTPNPDIEASVVAREYVSEGIQFFVFRRPEPGLVPLYRFFTPSGGHFYATSREAGTALGARFELTVGYIAQDERPGLRPLHAWHHPTADRYFYTTDPEGELAPRAGYRYQDILGYVKPTRRDG
jgi:uncharacterized protein DUF5648